MKCVTLEQSRRVILKVICQGCNHQAQWTSPLMFTQKIPQPTDYLTSSESCAETSLSESVSPVQCTYLCCSSEFKPFQPKGAEALRSLARNGHKFLLFLFWFEQYSWLTVQQQIKSIASIPSLQWSTTLLYLVKIVILHSRKLDSVTGRRPMKILVSHVHKEAKMKINSSGMVPGYSSCQVQ